MLETTIDRLAEHVGDSLGASGWITVDQTRIDAFAETTADRQWIHVDPARAAGGPFGTTVAHGFLTLSLVSHFLLDLLVVTDAGSVINYGLDRVRFPGPVVSGSAVRGSGELLGVQPLDTGGVQAAVRVVVSAEGLERPAAVADLLMRFLP